MPGLLVRALGLVNAMMRGLAEMAYEFEEPFVLDTSKYQSTFGAGGTALATAITATLAWYRGRDAHSETAKVRPVNRSSARWSPEAARTLDTGGW